MNTIQPFSTRNTIYFCQNKKRNVQQNSQDTDIYMSKKQFEKEKNISFIKGIIYATAILCGVNTCQNSERDFLLEQLSMEVDSFNPESDKLKVTDATNDNVPDIIIENNFGNKSIYDIKNKHLYYEDEYGTEKVY